MRNIAASFFSLVIVPTLLIAQDPLNVRGGIKAGYEFANYLSSQSESFKREPGLTIGYFTGIASASNSNATVILGFEINYVKLFFYQNNQHVSYNNLLPLAYDNTTRIQYNGVFDEQFSDQFVELCFPVEIYPQVLNKTITIGFYIGPSIGFGSEDFETREKSHTIIDSVKGLIYDQVYQEPTGYPGGNGFYVPISLNIGLKYYYKFFALDLGYKYTFNIPNPASNLFLQIGLAIEAQD
jgi:hypothetical protein